MTGPTLKVHPLAGALPAMLRDEYVELVADIKANGLREPLMLFEDQVLDGRHRYRACVELDITPTTKRFTGTTVDAKAYVVSLNVHRRHLTFEQRQKIAATELKRDPTQSDRAIGKKAKVDNKTVAKVRAAAERREEVPHVASRKDSMGRSQPAVKPRTATAGETAFSATSSPISVEPSSQPATALPPSTRLGSAANELERIDDVELLRLALDVLAELDRRQFRNIRKGPLSALIEQVPQEHRAAERRRAKCTSPDDGQTPEEPLTSTVAHLTGGESAP